jgi:hypothetical protein
MLMARFKARARTVDMLGRQQIAGIPNAISELFKNAHDAYADRVEVDYSRSDGLFVLRDDGLGMTKEDFEERWLTLGTESKIEGGKLAPPPVDKSKKPRPITGEKGIGRLAIAIIGPQVLVLTRAKRDETLYDLVAAFIHWGLFECPGINLDQIEIPVRTFPGGTLPTENDIKEMVEAVRREVRDLRKEKEIRSDEKTPNVFSEASNNSTSTPRKWPGASTSPVWKKMGMARISTFFLRVKTFWKM